MGLVEKLVLSQFLEVFDINQDDDKSLRSLSILTSEYHEGLQEICTLYSLENLALHSQYYITTCDNPRKYFNLWKFTRKRFFQHILFERDFFNTFLSLQPKVKPNEVF